MWPTLATAQKRLKDKIRFIMQSRLDSKIKEYNTEQNYGGTPYALEYPKSVNVGVAALQRERSGNVLDQLPALVVSISAATNLQDDMQNSQTLQVDLDVGAMFTSDIGDLDFNAERSQALIAVAADMLETYLPDVTGVAGHTIYRVDILNTATTRSEFASNTSLWAIISTAKVRVMMRSSMGHTAQYFPDGMAFKPFVESSYYPTGEPKVGYLSGSSVVELSALGLNQMTKVDVTSAITSSYPLAVDLGGTDIPSGTKFTLVNQANSSIMVSGTTSASYIELNPGYAMRSGDTWNLMLEHPTKNTLMTYSVNWLVS